MPAIGRSLGASVSALQWTLTSYLLAVATLLLLAGSPGRSVRAAARAGDRAAGDAGVLGLVLTGATYDIDGGQQLVSSG